MATEQWNRLKKANKLKSIIDDFHKNEYAIYNDRTGKPEESVDISTYTLDHRHRGKPEESKRLLIDAKSVIDKLLE